jgi:hypothetical protein
MKHTSGSNPGHHASQGRPESVDLVMQARAIRHQWLVSTCEGLLARLARFGSQPMAPAEPDPIQNPRAVSGTLSA